MSDLLFKILEVKSAIYVVKRLTAGCNNSTMPIAIDKDEELLNSVINDCKAIMKITDTGYIITTYNNSKIILHLDSQQYREIFISKREFDSFGNIEVNIFIPCNRYKLFYDWVQLMTI